MAAAIASGTFSSAAAPRLPQFTQIAVGSAHTCAITNANRLMCWGHNRFGQLGTDSRDNRWVPVEVAGVGRGIRAVATGAGHTCALTSAGGVKCWGNNAAGQLGDGRRTSSNVPVDVVGLGGSITAIAAGARSSCALTSGGGVKCWGWLGGDLPADRPFLRPVDVAGLTSGLARIAARAGMHCAVTTAGGVKCFSTRAVDVPGLASGVTAIAMGDATISLELGGAPSHFCALTSGGGVKCWGGNASGELGNRTTTSSNTPVDVVGLSSGVVAVAAGARFSCAVARGGRAVCWGVNEYYGQLGNGSAAKASTVPVAVAGLGRGVKSIAAGGNHACALMTAGRIKCWGNNYYGQLGNGTRTTSRKPVDVIVSPRSRSAGRVPAPPARQPSGYFQTPSRNIQCDYSRQYVRCGIRSGLRPPPPRRGPGCSVGRWVRLGVTGRVSVERSVCPGENEGDAGPFTAPGVARVLGYGKAWSGDGLSCTSALEGLTCRNRSGHGFFLSRARWRAF